jgi:ATP-dependent Lhr-like helicase
VSASPLDLFAPPVASWFQATLGEPTRAQALGWPAVARGESTLLIAPTGSGKTLAAFLVAIDRLMRMGSPRREPASRRAAPREADRGTRVLYVSPLKALAFDIERNLRVPLAGIAEQALREGVALAVPSVDVRTGDTTAKERARMRRAPGDILITTPESLYLLLTSSQARGRLATIDTLIVDEIHALIPSKRGAHLALSIERLEALRPSGVPPLQRIGLSATQRPLAEAARFLGGFEDGVPRPVTVVDAGAPKKLELTVEAVAPMSEAESEQDPTLRGTEGPRSGPNLWRGLNARVAELVRAHRSTIVFVNSRRLAERLAAALNDRAREDDPTGEAPGEVALAHHGSLAREKRTAIEERLKRGDLRAIVATSSLELGIDMGAVDLVVQIEAPTSVASGLQRIGRASHGVGGVPRGVLLPRHRQDLVACAAATASMRRGEVEETSYPRNPLDVLAQQIVAAVSVDETTERDLYDRVRRAAPFADLPRSALHGVLDMLSGRYPSDDFADLRPRITWDRTRGRITARTGSQRLAITSGGTIPDRGLYGVFAVAANSAAGADAAETGGRRVGELDEEMVFELRQGEVFLLGASSWRAEKITHDRVLVSPAAGQPGKMPFWHGDRPGRARSLGVRVGELVREIASGSAGPAELHERYSLEPSAATAIAEYVRDQVVATGEVPSDRSIVIERFVDEIGDWRVVVLCPLGARVIAPWALAVAARLREKYVDADVHYTDDGMAFRVPACEVAPPAELFLPSPDVVETLVTRALDGSALFAARFRECAGRALLLPRRDPGRRTPLWAQRKRSADLLSVASRHPDFPIVLETYRECLRDVFDLPGLVGLLRAVAARRVRVTTVDTRAPSPFGASVLFAFVANFIYDADAPLAERRAHAMAIDFDRLRELLGEAEIRQLLDADTLAEHERQLQRLSRPAAHADAVHDMLLAIGDLSLDELRARCTPPDRAELWAKDLVGARRAVALRVGGQSRFVAAEDAAKISDALGLTLPAGLPASLLEPPKNGMRDLVARYARTHGPFVPADVAGRFGVETRKVVGPIAELTAEGRLVEGAFLPGGTGRELCDREVLDALRRRSLAKLRRAVEPVEPRALARLVLEWQGVPKARRGRDALLAVIGELEGCPLIASALETSVLPARLEAYRPWDLDALCASGEVRWAGLESIGASDGRIALYRADREALLERAAAPVDGPLAGVVRDLLGRRGAVFFSEIARVAGGFPGQVLDVLWQMVWAGEVTNDTLEPLRSRARAGTAETGGRSRMRHPRAPRTGPPGSEGRWALRSPHGSPPAGDTDRRAALARALLDRYGVVTREAAHAEGIAGGFAPVYDVLKALEDQGRVRRGYFVEGHGGAQFALPGADERLRAFRAPDPAAKAIVLAASDPANAWGALLEWPAPAGGEARPQRSAGALVVLRDGAPLGWLGRAGHALLTFDRDDEAVRALASALGALVDSGDRRALLVATVDGVDAADSPVAAAFVATGFAATSRGLLKRRSGPAPAEPAHGSDLELAR